MVSEAQADTESPFLTLVVFWMLPHCVKQQVTPAVRAGLP